MTDFDRYFAQAHSESEAAMRETRRLRSEAGSELDRKREAMLPQIVEAGRQAVVKLRQARVPRIPDGWVLPAAGLVMSGRPINAYYPDKRSGLFSKTWKADYPGSRIGTLTPSGTLLANHSRSGQDRADVVYEDARIEIVDEFKAMRVSSSYGLADLLVIDRHTKALYVCFGQENELPSVIHYVEYCARATSALVQAWSNRKR